VNYEKKQKGVLFMKHHVDASALLIIGIVWEYLVFY